MFEILQLCIQLKKKKNPNLAFVEGGYNLRLCCIWFYTFDPTNQYFLFSVF